MSRHLAPVVFVLLLWWLSTGVILYLDGLPRRTFRWSLGIAAVLAAAALHVLKLSANEEGPAATYWAFTSAIVIWGWVEMALLMGLVSGPRRRACPSDVTGWTRAAYAFQTIAWHEIALLAAAALIVAATWGGTNRVGLLTFAMLWLCRQSTKLNLFLGVRNFSEEFLPDHLRYLETYFRRRAMNLLFPFSVTACAGGAALLWRLAFVPAIPDAAAIAETFLATLLTLALFEHWFLVAPIRVAALWDWSLRNRPAPLVANRTVEAGEQPDHCRTALPLPIVHSES